MNKRFILLFVFTLLSFATMMAQTITNVSSRQEDNRIIITYYLDELSDIELWYSIDGGKVFKGPLKKVIGDVGNNVTKGYKKIIWNVLEEMDGLTSSQVVFKVNSTSALGIEMIYVEGGSFRMGNSLRKDESPVREVTVDSYYISKYEITQDIWEKVMNGNNPSYHKGPKYPVENVSWDNVKVFIDRLNKLTGREYSLPTEAEWEYAAGGGKLSKKYKYPGGQYGPPYLTCYRTSSTHEVGLAEPNELGLYDMAGNVWEMCLDAYDEYDPMDTKNPVNKRWYYLRVSRGGCYSSSSVEDLTVTRRNLINATLPNKTVGFRLVLKTQ